METNVMKTQLQEVAVGAVVENGKLTTATRIGSHIQKPHVEPAETPEHAAAALLRLKGDLRRTRPCEPVVFLDSTTPVSGKAMTLICQNDSLSVDRLVDGLSRAHTCATGGVEFANRWSELLHAFLDDMTGGKIFVAPDADFEAQLTAFKRGERNGKIWYPAPSEVADTLGRYPVRAVAAVLACIAAPPPGGEQQQQQPVDYDPYANI
jgi:hypothetical protein